MLFWSSEIRYCTYTFIIVLNFDLKLYVLHVILSCLLYWLKRTTCILSTHLHDIFNPFLHSISFNLSLTNHNPIPPQPYYRVSSMYWLMCILRAPWALPPNDICVIKLHLLAASVAAHCCAPLFWRRNSVYLQQSCPTRWHNMQPDRCQRSRCYINTEPTPTNLAYQSSIR